ncbi:MAG: hypothetical protein WCB12_20110 [Bryobacteraceae bacterium]
MMEQLVESRPQPCDTVSDYHAAAVSLHMMYYNFARAHRIVKTTPAIGGGASDHVWSIEEIVALLDSK